MKWHLKNKFQPELYVNQCNFSDLEKLRNDLITQVRNKNEGIIFTIKKTKRWILFRALQNYLSIDNNATRELYQSKVVFWLFLLSCEQFSKSIDHELVLFTTHLLGEYFFEVWYHFWFSFIFFLLSFLFLLDWYMQYITPFD